MKSIYFGNRDLGQLTEKERQIHYENICEAAGLDPALNLLRYRMMDDGTGTGRQHLVLYAGKGAANAIRGVQGINDVEQTESQISTAYIVTTKVQNAKGRTLIAKGAVYIEGLSGRGLENAIALAQTRSSRRAVIAISGLDLLDESELGEVITNPVSDAPTPLPVVKQPAAKPNAAVGKDITAPAGLTLKAPPKSVTEEVFVESEPEPARLPNPAVGLKLAGDNLAGPGLNRAGRTVEKPAQAVVAAPAQAVTAPEELVVEEAPKKTRKKRTPKIISTEEAGLPAGGDYVNLSNEKIEESAPEVIKTKPLAVPAPKATVTTPGLPSAEQQKGYVARLQDLRENILPNAGLVLSHGLGPVGKLKKFVSVVNNNIGIENLGKLTVAQWESTFEYIDGILSAQGPEALVASINYNIGAVDEPVAQ